MPRCSKRLLAATRCPHLSPALHQPSPETRSDFQLLCVWRRAGLAAVVNLTYGGALAWRLWSRSVTGEPNKPRHRPKPPRHPPRAPFLHILTSPSAPAQVWLLALLCTTIDGARTCPPPPRMLGRAFWTSGTLWRRKMRVFVCVMCVLSSVSENSKSGIVLDSDESSTSVPPFHIIYTIGTQKTERGGHQGRREARKSKAILRRISLVGVGRRLPKRADHNLSFRPQLGHAQLG